MSLDTTATVPESAASRFDTIATFCRILVPVDFNQATQCAVAEALQLRRRFGSEVHLFHLAEQDEATRFLAGTGANPVSVQELIEDAEERLRRFVENVLPGHEPEVTIHANVGVDVADAVLEEAARVNATLVVVGVDPSPRLFRTQVEKLVQRLACSVLLVRAPSRGA